jgi:hypothetical protein
MRIVASSLLALALTPLSGCMTLHADVPEEVIRRHVSQEEGIDLSAICSHEGKTYSEGAIACMAKQRMTCDPGGRWVKNGDC